MAPAFKRPRSACNLILLVLNIANRFLKMIGDNTISPSEALKNAIWNGCKSLDRSLTNACIATNNTDASAIKIIALLVKGNSLKRV